jgi:hypothetical protein
MQAHQEQLFIVRTSHGVIENLAKMRHSSAAPKRLGRFPDLHACGCCYRWRGGSPHLSGDTAHPASAGEYAIDESAVLSVARPYTAHLFPICGNVRLRTNSGFDVRKREGWQ